MTNKNHLSKILFVLTKHYPKPFYNTQCCQHPLTPFLYHANTSHIKKKLLFHERHFSFTNDILQQLFYIEIKFIILFYIRFIVIIYSIADTSNQPSCALYSMQPPFFFTISSTFFNPRP